MTFRSLLLAPIAAIATISAASPAPIAPAGVDIHDVRIGTGAEARPGRAVTVHYTGWLFQDGRRGKKFDSSRDRGEPFTFRLGAGEVIRGWDDGVAGMKVGGMRTLVLSPDAGYGSEGDDDIPLNSYLIFDIELLGVG